MGANAALLEWAWTLLALAGVGLGLLAVWATLLDAATAFYPPRGLHPTLEERALGAWLAMKWVGITACHVLNLIIGLRALTTPSPVPPDHAAAVAESALLTGLCLLGVEMILVGLTFGQLYTRWLVLRLPARRAPEAAPPVEQAPPTEAGSS